MLVLVSRKPRSLEPEQTQRVKDALNLLLAEHKTQTALAKALGFSQQAISRVLAGESAGTKLALVVARATGQTYEQLVDGAAPGGPHVVYDDRYPLRARALARLRGVLSPSAERHVRGANFQAAEAWDELRWLRYALDTERRYLDGELESPPPPSVREFTASLVGEAEKRRR